MRSLEYNPLEPKVTSFFFFDGLRFGKRGGGDGNESENEGLEARAEGDDSAR